MSSIGTPIRIFTVAAITALALFAASFWALSQVGVAQLEPRAVTSETTSHKSGHDGNNKPCPPKGNYGKPGNSNGNPNQGTTQGEGKKCGHR